MRKVIYIACLVASTFALSTATGIGLFWLINMMSPIRGVLATLIAPLYLVSFLPFALIAVRGFIWFKRRRVDAPASFHGLPYGVACLVVGLFVLAALSYTVLIFTGSGSGLSGVPLGMLMLVCGALLALTMPIVEVQDWRAFFKARKVNKTL